MTAGGLIANRLLTRDVNSARMRDARLRVAEAAVAQRPDDLDARLRLAFAYQRDALDREALEQYKKVLAVDPGNQGALYNTGLKVYTTLDFDMYKMAEQVAREQIKKLTDDKRNVTNGSVIIIRQSTGEIMAMVGSVNYFDRTIDGQVNIATAARQPGSSFKLFNYLSAFMKGASPSTVVYDVRTAFDDSPNPPYTPENYDRKYHGPVSLRTALGSSFNIPAVKVEELGGAKTLASSPQACPGENAGRCGVREIVRTAHRLGITTLDPASGGREKYGLALTLGGGEVTLLDMTYAFGVVGNGGIMAGAYVAPEDQKPDFRRLDPISILKVVDASGNTLYEYKPPQTAPLANSKTGSLVCAPKEQYRAACLEQIVPAPFAYLITDVLSDNNARAPGFGINSIIVPGAAQALESAATRQTPARSHPRTPDLLWHGKPPPLSPRQKSKRHFLPPTRPARSGARSSPRPLDRKSPGDRSLRSGPAEANSTWRPWLWRR